MSDPLHIRVDGARDGYRGPCSDAILSAAVGDRVVVTIEHPALSGAAFGVIELVEGDRVLRFIDLPTSGAMVKAALALVGETARVESMTLNLDDDDIAHRMLTSWQVVAS